MREFINKYINIYILFMAPAIIAMRNKMWFVVSFLPCYLLLTIILLLYWLMLILSRVFYRMILGDPKDQKPLFSKIYGILGAAAVLAIIMSVQLLSVVPSEDLDLVDSYKFIIGSIVIPFIPIAIQAVQILSPKNKTQN